MVNLTVFAEAAPGAARAAPMKAVARTATNLRDMEFTSPLDGSLVSTALGRRRPGKEGVDVLVGEEPARRPFGLARSGQRPGRVTPVVEVLVGQDLHAVDDVGELGPLTFEDPQCDVGAGCAHR